MESVSNPSNAREASGSHVVLYLLATGFHFSGVTRPGYGADHAPVSSVEATNVWRYSSLSVFSAKWLIKHNTNFTFTIKLILVFSAVW